MGAPSQEGRVAVGQVRRLVALGETSLYRVVALDDSLVRAEVIDVPGLPTGLTVCLTVEAVAAMDLVDAPSATRPGPIADAA
jgi:hypothetical protein